MAAELLRVVVAPDAADGAGDAGGRKVVPDPRRRLPGRGAWLHRDPRCAELAQRRRAFARALQVSRALDPAPVVEYLAEHYGDRTTSGTPQEMTSYGHSMKRQQ